MNKDMKKKMSELFLKVKDLYWCLDSTCDFFEDFARLIDSNMLAERLDLLYNFSAALGDFFEDFFLCDLLGDFFEDIEDIKE